jgi:hypothetical protein
MVGHEMGWQRRNAYRILVHNCEGNRRKCDDKVKVVQKEVGGSTWIGLI